MVAESLATSVVAALTPLVVKGAAAVGKAAGAVAAEKASAILTTLKEKFAGDGEAAGMLKRFEDNPTRYRPIMEDVLGEKIAADPDLTAKLQSLLKEMGSSLKVVQDMGDVSGEVTGVEASQLAGGAKVSVEQKADKVSGKVTGARIDRIG